MGLFDGKSVEEKILDTLNEINKKISKLTDEVSTVKDELRDASRMYGTPKYRSLGEKISMLAQERLYESDARMYEVLNDGKNKKK